MTKIGTLNGRGSMPSLKLQTARSANQRPERSALAFCGC